MILEYVIFLFLKNIFEVEILFKVFVGDYWWVSFFIIYVRCCYNIKKDLLISYM